MHAQRVGMCRVIVVNDNWRMVPSADALYACDRKWWTVHHASIEASGFAGERWTQDLEAAHAFGLDHVQSIRTSRGNGIGLCRTPGVVHTGSNSGYQAINLAYHFGARNIVLLGYDMQRSLGQKHWFGEHPKELTSGDPSAWVAGFDALGRDLAGEGVRVINASRLTALTCFTRFPIAQALACTEELAA